MEQVKEWWSKLPLIDREWLCEKQDIVPTNGRLAKNATGEEIETIHIEFKAFLDRTKS